MAQISFPLEQVYLVHLVHQTVALHPEARRQPQVLEATLEQLSFAVVEDVGSFIQ
jgi:hypothetical protein